DENVAVVMLNPAIRMLVVHVSVVSANQAIDVAKIRELGVWGVDHSALFDVIAHSAGQELMFPPSRRNARGDINKTRLVVDEERTEGHRVERNATPCNMEAGEPGTLTDAVLRLQDLVVHPEHQVAQESSAWTIPLDDSPRC